MERSARRLRKARGHVEGSHQPHAPARPRAHRGVPPASETLTQVACFAESQRSGGRCGASLHPLAGLPLRKKRTEMLAAIEKIWEKYPQSRWAEEALMAGGNYYWVELQRSNAVSYYQRILDAYPAGKNAYNAEWRIAWVAYLDRLPYADDKMSIFLRKYPVSAAAVNALYWLGRNAERGGNPAHARAYYAKAIERFPTSYFAEYAAAHLEKLGPGEADPVDFLAHIPPAPPLRASDEPVAPIVADRWNRAQALRTIAFDASAELELKAAFTATASPRFILEAAQAAFDQGHF